MNEVSLKNMEVINNLNKVEGFDPAAFLRRLTGESGEEQFYLDVKYRKLWFRLKYPNGKITKRIVKLDNDFAIIESKVYLDRNDAEDCYISCAMAQRWRSDDDTYGKKYVETAETAAVGRALADAGFGIQFAEPGEEKDSSPVDSPVVVPDEKDVSARECEKKVPSSTEDDDALPEGFVAKKPVADEKDKSLNTDKKTKEFDESTPVEKLLKDMTLEDAKNVVIPFGAYKDKTLGALCIEKPSAVNWYVESYRGKNNILRAAAQLLLQSAE